MVQKIVAVKPQIHCECMGGDAMLMASNVIKVMLSFLCNVRRHVVAVYTDYYSIVNNDNYTVQQQEQMVLALLHYL